MADPVSAAMLTGGVSTNAFSMGNLGKTLGDIGNFASGLASLGGLFSGHGKMYRQYKYQKLLMRKQYDLNQKSLLESPTNARQGLVDAGYNPILAATNGTIPQSGLGSSSISPSPDVSGQISSAIDSILNRKQLAANIENTNASTVLTTQEAESERNRTELLNQQTIYQQYQNLIAEKDYDYYEQKMSAEIYSKVTMANSMASNADTNARQLGMQLELTSAERKFLKDHPEFSAYMVGAGMLTKPIGDIVHFGFNGSFNSPPPKPMGTRSVKTKTGNRTITDTYDLY